jgi:transposase
MGKKVNTSYTQEYRSEAVKLVLEQGLGVTEASNRLGMPFKTLSAWVCAARAGKLSGVNIHRKAQVTDQEAEIKRLQKALAMAHMERDILKKATAYFAKESLQSTRS